MVWFHDHYKYYIFLVREPSDLRRQNLTSKLDPRDVSVYSKIKVYNYHSELSSKLFIYLYIRCIIGSFTALLGHSNTRLLVRIET